MSRKILAALLFICATCAVLAIFTFKLSGTGGNPLGIVDPDLSDEDLVSGLIDKTEYLKRRADYFLSLRGWEEGEVFDPDARGRAILEMQEQEQQLLAIRERTAASPTLTSAENYELALSSTEWTELGPAPIPNGQTEGTPTAVSGRTTAIAVHPTDPNIAFVGTAQGGLYRTLDGGANWAPMMDNAQTLAIGAVAFAPSDPTIVYVGTGEANLSADSFFGVGLYRINNALAEAPELTGPINPPVTTAIAGTTAFSGVSISKVVVHPTDPATIFVSTTTGSSGNPGGGSLHTTVPPVSLTGVYRSVNATAPLNSVTFQKLTVTKAGSVAPDESGNRSIIDLVMEPGVPNKLVCTVLGTNGTTPAGDPDGGVYVTTNALDPSPTFTRTLALGAGAGSEGTSAFANQGRAELAINKVGLGPAAAVTIYVASGEVAPNAQSCVNAGGAVAGGGSLRRSVDGGTTWTPPIAAASGFCAGQCFYDIAVAVDPINPNTVLIGGSVTAPNAGFTTCSKLIARSDDSGATFVPVSTGVHADNHAVVFAPSNPTVVYMGTDGGIYKSTNGGATWAVLNNSSFRATQFQSIATHPADREIMLGGTQDNGTIKKNSDGSWTRTDSGDGGYALFGRNSTGVNSAIAYHTTQAGTNSISWRRSTNSGTSWSSNSCGGNGIACSDLVLFYPPIALGPGNPSPLYYGTQKLYRSSNGTSAAVKVSQDVLSADAVPTASPTPQVLTTIAISPQDDNVRLVGLRNGKVFATSTGSPELTNVTISAMPTPNPGTIRRAVSRAMFHPNDQKTAFVTFGGYNVQDGHHIWKTTNLDTSANAPAVEWTPTGVGIPDVPVNCLVIDRLAPNNMYVGTDIGVYRSSNGGALWTPFSSGLPRIAIFDIAFQEQIGSTSTDRVLRVATHGRGIWEIAIPAGPPLPVDGAVSRKVHGGTARDINLPLTGDPGVECRNQTSAPDTHQVVISFPTSVTVSDAEVTFGTGTVAGFTPSGTEIVVDLTGVPNAQTLVVTLFDVNNVGNVNVPMAILQGDVEANRSVSSSDVNRVKRTINALLSGTNFRHDIDVDGSISSSDVNRTKSRVGSGLP